MEAELPTLLSLQRSILKAQRLADRLLAVYSIPQLLEKTAERDKESLTQLAQIGWFFGPRMAVSVIPGLARVAESHPDVVDEYFARHIRANLDEIEEELSRSCPHRSKSFESAFRAHREGDYNLSIQGFLQQADGVFNDRYGRAGSGNERELYRMLPPIIRLARASERL